MPPCRNFFFVFKKTSPCERSTDQGNVSSEILRMNESANSAEDVHLRVFFPEGNYYRTFATKKSSFVEELFTLVERRQTIPNIQLYGFFVTQPNQKSNGYWLEKSKKVKDYDLSPGKVSKQKYTTINYHFFLVVGCP
jgi:hypothetical protein